MIPNFNLHGVLPPFSGAATAPDQRSPYLTTMLEVVQRLGTTPHRRAILLGLCTLRDQLRGVGFSVGFQWIDGSFVEAKVPGDVDVVTWVNVSIPGAQLNAIATARPDLFNPRAAKQTYRTDHYLMNLAVLGDLAFSMITFWYGLFSHQRDTQVWKGMLAVDLADPTEAAAVKLLHERGVA